MSQRRTRRKIRQQKEEQRALRIMGSVVGASLLLFLLFLFLR